MKMKARLLIPLAFTGAHGLILSRKYSEMRLANLEAAGKAMQDYARA